MKYLVALLLVVGLTGCKPLVQTIVCTQQGKPILVSSWDSNNDLEHANQTCTNNADGTITLKLK